MRQREEHGERSHRRVWELLPWYVNGSLAQGERERVEAHLAVCSRCQEETRLCRRTADEIAGAGEVAPSPHPVQFQRLLARIDDSEREEQLQKSPRRVLAPFRSMVRATPRPLRWALLAQAAMIFLLLGFVAWSGRQPGLGAVYRTLSDPPAPAVRTVRLRVVFAPAATEREIRGLLLGLHAEITAGPSAYGAYTLEVPAAGDPARVVLAHLRAEPQVMLAEPVPGGAETIRP